MSSLWLILLFLFAALVVRFWWETHDRRQVRGLIERLDKLEFKMPEEIDSQSNPGNSTEDAKSEFQAHASADVLHGRTTFIEKPVAGENSGE